MEPTSDKHECRSNSDPGAVRNDPVSIQKVMQNEKIVKNELFVSYLSYDSTTSSIISSHFDERESHLQRPRVHNLLDGSW